MLSPVDIEMRREAERMYEVAKAIRLKEERLSIPWRISAKAGRGGVQVAHAVVSHRSLCVEMAGIGRRPVATVAPSAASPAWPRRQGARGNRRDCPGFQRARDVLSHRTDAGSSSERLSGQTPRRSRYPAAGVP